MYVTPSLDGGVELGNGPMCVGQRRALPHVIVLLALCFLASPVLAEEVLHCIDTENTGFHWEGGHASKTNFELSRFFVKIGPAEGAIRLLSENDRLITQASEGVLQHKSAEYRCEKISGMGSIVCNDKAANGMPWLFGSNGHYVRAYLLGGPGGPRDPKTFPLDPNIFIAYGICTKF